MMFRRMFERPEKQHILSDSNRIPTVRFVILLDVQVINITNRAALVPNAVLVIG